MVTSDDTSLETEEAPQAEKQIENIDPEEEEYARLWLWAGSLN